VGWRQQDTHPVDNVTWNDAVAFCHWLSHKEGTTYRLPTEAQWEYACRAGTDSVYSSGDDVASLESIANIADSSLRQKYAGAKWTQSWDDGYPFTAPVGRFRPNGWGLYDMRGNVREWCQDRYTFYDSEKAVKRAQENSRVVRGGSFYFYAQNARSAFRYHYLPGYRSLSTGFRVARTYP